MRLQTLWIGSLAGLAALTGVALADVPGRYFETRGNMPAYLVDASFTADPGSSLTAPELRHQGMLGLIPHRSGADRPDPDPGAMLSGVPSKLRYDDGFLTALPAASGDADWECLAQAIYFEARGESIKGQFAIAEVILNRLDSPLYPKTICRVVHQGGSGGCQFSFTCDGVSDKIRERDAFRTAGKIARLMLDGAPRMLTDGATHFHTRSSRPGWAHRMPQTASIGQHMFYRIASTN